MRHRLGEYLVESGLITQEQLHLALRRQAEARRPFGHILREAGWLSARTLAESLADQLALEYADVSALAPDLRALRALPRETAQALAVLPIRRDPAALVVALADPLDIAVLEELELRTGGSVQPAVADEEALPTAIASAYDALERHQTAVTEARRTLRRAADSPAVRRRMPRLVSCAGSAPGIGVSTVVGTVATVANAVGHEPVILETRREPSGTDGGLVLRGASAGAPATRHAAVGPIRCLSLAADAELDRADDLELVSLAGHVLALGERHDPILLDLGAPTTGAAVRLLAAADVSVLVTTPQDLVRAYDLIRSLARLPRDPTGTAGTTTHWTLGIVVTLVNDASGGRAVFDQLQRAVEEHVNTAPHALAAVELGFLGAVRWRAEGPPLAGGVEVADPTVTWGSDLDDYVSVTKAIMDRASRARPDPWPMAGLVNFACGNPEGRALDLAL